MSPGGETRTPSAPPHSLRRRIVCTLLLVLLAAGAELWHALHPGSTLPLQLVMALLCNAAAWEAWRADTSKGHLFELASALLFPWVLLLSHPGAEGTDGQIDAESITRHFGASFACWAVVALTILIRDGMQLRGLGMPLIQQTVSRDILRFLYPVGFLGLAFVYPTLFVPFIGTCLLYRVWRALCHNMYAALGLTALCTIGFDVLCKILSGNPGYGLPNVLQMDSAEATFVAGLSLILAALLVPGIKLVRFFRSKLSSGESPLPVIGYLGDVLALPALPCALVALLLLARWMLPGSSSTLNL